MWVGVSLLFFGFPWTGQIHWSLGLPSHADYSVGFCWLLIKGQVGFFSCFADWQWEGAVFAYPKLDVRGSRNWLRVWLYRWCPLSGFRYRSVSSLGGTKEQPQNGVGSLAGSVHPLGCMAEGKNCGLLLEDCSCWSSLMIVWSEEWTPRPESSYWPGLVWTTRMAQARDREIFL